MWFQVNTLVCWSHFYKCMEFDSCVVVDIKKLYLTLKQTEQIVHIETSDVILTIFDARNK